MPVSEIKALLEVFGAPAAALIFLAMIWMRESGGNKSADAPAPVGGLSDADKLWLLQEVLGPILTELRTLEDLLRRR